MNNEEQINDAITNHLSVLYDLEPLASVYDKNVIQAIENIATFATNNVLMSNDDDVTNHRLVKIAVSQKYPFLTEAAKIKIADIAAYFWK